MNEQQPASKTIVLSVPGRRVWALLAAIAAAVLVLIAIPFMATTMRTEIANCGTIFASSDTWTYKSTYSGPEPYFRGSRDPEASVGRALDAMMSDLNRGANAFDVCEEKHHDRKVLLLTLGGTALALLMAGTILWWSSRPNPPQNARPAT